MALQWQEAREKVIRYARKLQAERLVYSTAGNISLRIPARAHARQGRDDVREPRLDAAADLDRVVRGGRPGRGTARRPGRMDRIQVAGAVPRFARAAAYPGAASMTKARSRCWRPSLCPATAEVAPTGFEPALPP